MFKVNNKDTSYEKPLTIINLSKGHHLMDILRLGLDLNPITLASILDLTPGI